MNSSMGKRYVKNQFISNIYLFRALLNWVDRYLHPHRIRIILIFHFTFCIQSITNWNHGNFAIFNGKVLTSHFEWKKKKREEIFESQSLVVAFCYRFETRKRKNWNKLCNKINKKWHPSISYINSYNKYAITAIDSYR